MILNPDPPARPRACIIILNWNQPDLTARCLATVEQLVGVGFDTLVIDNGSDLPNRDRAAVACRGRCSFLALPVNQGFAGGMNVGIRHAAAAGREYVWLLNNDAFPEPDCLARLIAALDAEPGLAAVSPRLARPDGSEQAAGGRADLADGVLIEMTAADLARPPDRHGWLTGTAPCCRTAAVLAAGGFDESLFAYWEDVDLSLRLVAAGQRLRAVPEAACLHAAGTSSGEDHSPFALFLYARNGWRVLRRHRGAGRGRAAFAALYAARMLAEAARMDGQGERARGVALVRGLWAGILGRYGAPRAGSGWQAGWQAALWLTRRRPFAVALARLTRAAGSTARRPT